MCVCLVSQVWANYEEKPAEEFVHVSEEKERVAKYRAVYVTEITDTLHFYTQDVETGNVKLCLTERKTSAPVLDECQQVCFPLLRFYSL